MEELTKRELELILLWANTVDYDYGFDREQAALRWKLEQLLEEAKKKELST